MKAICVDGNRDLELREIASPAAPPPGYVTVEIVAAAINHGDRTFLKLPEAAGGMRGERIENIWGASAAGLVTAIGEDVPPRYLGRKVAIYRSLQPDLPILGLWCETAQLSYRACLLLGDDADPRDYSGSLVNVVTAYAFLEQAIDEGHRGILVTAGGSATGRALEALARRRGVSTVTIVRDATANAGSLAAGGSSLVVADGPDLVHELEQATREIGATAVFDGVGGDLLSRILPALPTRSSIAFYGFLSGAQQVSFHSALFMAKDFIMRRFSNFDSPTVRDEGKLAAMLEDLENCIADEAFRTRVGETFGLSSFDAAMGYHGHDAGRAVFVPGE